MVVSLATWYWTMLPIHQSETFTTCRNWWWKFGGGWAETILHQDAEGWIKFNCWDCGPDYKRSVVS